MNYELSENTSELLPKTLNDIIRTNRDHAELRLAKTVEIDALVGIIDKTAVLKDEIGCWRLISLIDKEKHTVQILLAGDSRLRKHPAITSPILRIDFAKGYVLTKSHSVYKLGNRGLGEPPEDDLLCLCAALHQWGAGAALGVPNFAY
ncbi:MAG TPA: hypothetical protein VNW52_11090 [Burkholderiaceae bacterium]|jgi:hypothetical protein|nr:hypothetical protein [Burkholderiaceae bacterium]